MGIFILVSKLCLNVLLSSTLKDHFWLLLRDRSLAVVAREVLAWSSHGSNSPGVVPHIILSKPLGVVLIRLQVLVFVLKVVENLWLFYIFPIFQTIFSI
jgi:hypothetical protein